VKKRGKKEEDGEQDGGGYKQRIGYREIRVVWRLGRGMGIK
jgi:hypothetical protein